MKNVAESQFEQCKVFHKEVIEEAGRLKRGFDALMKRIQCEHDDEPDRSVLKSPLKEYESCFPS